jgi:AcrR family transcriptional regulator
MKGTRPNAAQIVEVAARMFADKGYANVSIRDVCREADTTAPMIYYYFKDKKGLFEAAVRRKISIKEFIGLLRKETEVTNPREAIKRFIDVYLSSFPAHAFDPGLYLRETAQLDSKSAEMASRQLDEIQSLASKIIKEGMSRGAFRESDPEKSADCLIGMLNRVVFQRIHFSRVRDIKEFRDFIDDFFTRAMKTGRPSSR